ncbi:MAG: hypothetical protein IPH48_10930 [bacterium]|nr:hypothetical protein [bacterium]
MIRTLNLSARRAWAPLLAAALLTASTALAAGAPQILYLGGGDKPAGPAAPRALAPFDCAGRDTLTLAPRCGTPPSPATPRARPRCWQATAAAPGPSRAPSTSTASK